MNEMVAQNDVQRQLFVTKKGTVLHERETLGNSMSGCAFFTHLPVTWVLDFGTGYMDISYGLTPPREKHIFQSSLWPFLPSTNRYSSYSIIHFRMAKQCTVTHSNWTMAYSLESML